MEITQESHVDLPMTQTKPNNPTSDIHKDEILGPLSEALQQSFIKVDSVRPKIKKWEEDLHQKFTGLDRLTGNQIFKDPQTPSEIINKFQSVTKNMESLEQLIFPDADQKPKQSSQDTYTERETSEHWSMLKVVDRVLESQELRYLMASLEHLSSISKMCALYYSVFPECCEMCRKRRERSQFFQGWAEARGGLFSPPLSRRQIMYWWMAEEWAIRKDGKTAEEVAVEIFDEHVNQGLITPIRKGDAPFTRYFTVHPWIHRGLVSVAKEAGLFGFRHDRSLSNGCRRLFLHYGDDSDSVKGDEDLVSVFNISERYLRFQAEWLARMKKLVVLQLGRWQNLPEHHIEIENEESLRGLKGQKYLKYLSLRGISRITTLPKSIMKLVSLEILDIRACHNLERLPSGISALRNLTHLDVSECYLVENMPSSIGKLSNLEVFKGFVVGKKGSSSKIDDLVSLRKLRKLSIYIGSKALEEKQDFEKLGQIESLHNLAITWAINLEKISKKSEKGVARTLSKPAPKSESRKGSTSAADQKTDKESVTGVFSFPPRLQKLDLRCIPEKDAPAWLVPEKLVVLEKLYIRGGQLEEFETPEFREIKTLRLKYLKKLKVTQEYLQTRFPKTDYMEKTGCDGDDFVVIKNGDDFVVIKRQHIVS